MLWREFETPFANEFGWMDREFDQFRQDMWRLLGGEQPSYLRPPINVWLKQDKVIVAAELPGVEADHIDISLEGQTLRLKGRRQPVALDEKSTYLQQERRSGEFVRTVNLPYHVEANQIAATFNHGVLVIELPRAESEKPRKIAVTASV